MQNCSCSWPQFFTILCQSVYPDGNHRTVVRLRLDLQLGASPVLSCCVYAITTVKRIWQRGWSSPLCIIFFRFQHHGYFTYHPKTNGPVTTKTKSFKHMSQNEVCSLDIETQYWTNLYGIALKNNELNVAIADMRHWELVLICILGTAWQRVSADIFAPVHNGDMITQFLCARSCTANIFVYKKVCVLAKCNLFPWFMRHSACV